MAGHLDRERGRVQELLSLQDGELVQALGGRRRRRLAVEHERFDAGRARERLREAGLEAICRCSPRYPGRLRALESAPAVLHVAGDLERVLSVAASDAVAIVGSRRASSYGLGIARGLARSLAAAGVPVISGMAHGIDAAAHEGALAAGGLTLAVLASEPQRPYPASARALHRRIVATGAVVSELPPATPVRRWMFPARNRLIAALASMTVVVEAGERSGALLTAAISRSLGRATGAVPGHVTSPLAAGCHRLLRDGARLIERPEDILEALFGAAARVPRHDGRPRLDREHRRLLEAIAAGENTADALGEAGVSPDLGLAALAWLEVAGYVRREAGGRWSAVP